MPEPRWRERPARRRPRSRSALGRVRSCTRACATSPPPETRPPQASDARTDARFPCPGARNRCRRRSTPRARLRACPPRPSARPRAPGLSCRYAYLRSLGSPRSFGLFVVVPARVEGQPSAVVAAVLAPRVRALEDRSAGGVGARAGVGGSARPAPLACRAEAVVYCAPRRGVVRREDGAAAPRDADAAATEASHRWVVPGPLIGLRAASTASLAGMCGVVARQRAQLRCIMSPSQGRRAGTAPWGKADVIGDGRGARGPSVRLYELNRKFDARRQGLR